MSGHKSWRELRAEILAEHSWHWRLRFHVGSFIDSRFRYPIEQYRWNRAVRLIESWGYEVTDKYHD